MLLTYILYTHIKISQDAKKIAFKNLGEKVLNYTKFINNPDTIKFISINVAMKAATFDFTAFFTQNFECCTFLQLGYFSEFHYIFIFFLINCLTATRYVNIRSITL